MSGKVRFHKVSWLVVLIVLMAIWELLWRYTKLPHAIFPSPQATLAAFVELSKDDLWKTVLLSLLRCFEGFSMGTSLGIAFGIAMGMSRSLYSALSPFLNALYAVPSVALIPILMAWLGLTNSTIVTAAIVSSFINSAMVSATGIANVPRTVVKTAKAMGAKGMRLIFNVYLPLSLGSIFTGMKLGLEHAWKTTIAAEMLIGIKGLGMTLVESEGLLRVDILFATVVVIGAFGWIFERVLSWMEGKLVRYVP